jgi:hypothetical protein
VIERDGMALRRALAIRSDHADLAQVGERLGERDDPRRRDAVVIGDE